ncbi:hypothetical protein CDD82_3234 [Ophiocordyceps australis]|uniref:Iron-sulfur assembly protein 1 n=1 Tax=Ophiocordyceps australis TaxID=1399860 RepID=A0A2C5ZQ20_9HYPO|nr:hypothetical protein CDD82_3234 [Ophiocordyceps australis]
MNCSMFAVAPRRALLHFGLGRHSLPRRTVLQTHSYHAYSLPSSPRPERSDDGTSAEPIIPETPLAQPPPPLPRVHETRPPSRPKSQPESEAATASADTPRASTDTQKPAARPRSRLRARKAAMKLTPAAVEQLRILLDQPEPKLIKVGVRNRGCSGLAYHLEYVDKAGAFDETVEQDGVKVLIDSKALFSIIGSEMDWAEDKLNQRFVFRNPNIKEQCGCGESFMV